MKTKAISIRVPEKMLDELAAIARTEDVPISETIRAAVAEYIASRPADPEFQKRLKRKLEEDRDVMERLLSGEAPPKGN